MQSLEIPPGRAFWELFAPNGRKTGHFQGWTDRSPSIIFIGGIRKMRLSPKRGIVVPLLVAAAAVTAPACGGPTAARAVTSPQPPPVAQWEGPFPLSYAATPVPLD